MLTPDQEEFLRQELNFLERLGRSLSFNDEYLTLLIGTQNQLVNAIRGLSAAGLPDIAPVLQSLTEAINALIAAMGTSGAAALENPANIASGELLCPVAGVGYKLPGYEIPWDKAVVVKALNANVGIIRVGNTRVDAQTAVIGYPLIRNETIAYKIRNVGRLWVSSTIPGEGIHWTVEQA